MENRRSTEVTRVSDNIQHEVLDDTFIAVNDVDIPSFCILEQSIIVSKEEDKARLESIEAIRQFSIDYLTLKSESRYSQRHESIVTQSTISDESISEFIHTLILSIVNNVFRT